MTGDPKLDAILTFLTFPFVATCIALFVAAIWLAFQDEAKREQQPLISPETEAAREALHRAAWGGGEQ